MKHSFLTQPWVYHYNFQLVLKFVCLFVIKFVRSCRICLCRLIFYSWRRRLGLFSFRANKYFNTPMLGSRILPGTLMQPLLRVFHLRSMFASITKKAHFVSRPFFNNLICWVFYALTFESLDITSAHPVAVQFLTAVPDLGIFVLRDCIGVSNYQKKTFFLVKRR